MIHDCNGWRLRSSFEHPELYRVLVLVLCGILVACAVCSQVAVSADQTTLVFATTDSSNERVRNSGGKLSKDKPGWFVELSKRAAGDCGAKAEFAFMPWRRALQKVEGGEVQAAL